jgi:hypothetical protein
VVRELIVRATAIGMLDGRDPTESAIAGLIVAELGEPGPPPFTLPEPASPAAVEAAASSPAAPPKPSRPRPRPGRGHRHPDA